MWQVITVLLRIFIKLETRAPNPQIKTEEGTLNDLIHKQKGPFLINFSMNTFIKICLLDTGGRISEIQKQLQSSGGYDFYKPLQKAVRAHCSGNHDEVKDVLEAPSNDIERLNNRTAYDAFETKFGSNKTLEALLEPKKLEFPDAGISITASPLFELTKSGTRQIYSLWPTKSPDLTQRYGAVACHLMRTAYSSASLGNGAFFYADLVGNRVYSEKQINENTDLILKADIASIGRLVKEL